MIRKDFEKLIEEKYSVEPEYPWQSAPSFAVFRHDINKKWFAVIMTITKDKLGLDSTEEINVVNLKCDPLFMGSVLNETGIFPAYHMNKTHWNTVYFDGDVPREEVLAMVEHSFQLTCPKEKQKCKTK